MEEKNMIFRRESLESISAPDQLTDYLRVSRPMVWAVIAAIAAVITGLLVWAFAGTFEVSVSGKASVRGGEAVIVINDNSQYTIRRNVKAYTSDNDELTVSDVYDDGFDRTLGYANTDIRDGIYDVRIIVGQKHPIDLLFGE